MKKLNRANYTVIDEFGCDITTIVNVFENEQNGKLLVIDEFDLGRTYYDDLEQCYRRSDFKISKELAEKFDRC